MPFASKLRCTGNKYYFFMGYPGLSPELHRYIRLTEDFYRILRVAAQLHDYGLWG